jgi:hypothetical protein
MVGQMNSTAPFGGDLYQPRSRAEGALLRSRGFRFSEADYADLLDAAHQNLKAPRR